MRRFGIVSELMDPDSERLIQQIALNRQASPVQMVHRFVDLAGEEELDECPIWSGSAIKMESQQLQGEDLGFVSPQVSRMVTRRGATAEQLMDDKTYAYIQHVRCNSNEGVSHSEEGCESPRKILKEDSRMRCRRFAVVEECLDQPSLSLFRSLAQASRGY